MPSRSQLTLRLDPKLARHLKQAAAARGVSVNAFAEQTLAAAVDPDAAGSEVERLRERLARAGILADTGPPVDFEPPSDEEFERARRNAGRRGLSAADLITQDRQERGF